MAGRSAATYGVLCILVGALLALAYVNAPMLQTLITKPSINDITTDLLDPPKFISTDIPAYPAAFADKQREGYPEIAPLILPDAPDAVFRRATDVAIDLGWRIRHAEPQSGRIEAVATTSFLRFKDDVVVRLRPQESGTRVDIRSRSRIGRHDLGTNARRIREFFKRLQR
ncbi:DUF1499 domain-containing protein [Thalassobaculum sp. OXR-137]|uniref:DUF1499 domain-containing protein n=1 Tax=Thalassobaculum sp. OXR-137 TaxID=3100173 RepID=UPI002AC8A4C4|nr:DUF1499 domain-containing protein [Thalassobaculum sp. OXR-137]WPZ32905.1 DUF1499 domain-containing protein [Thalassobaculum sp. OXR-137]